MQSDNTSFFKRLAPVILLISSIFLVGCVSSRTSSTATYGGPSVSSANAKRSDARKDISQARRDARTARKDIRSLERSIKRAERKLKRKRTSKKAARQLKKDIRSSKRDIRKAKRALSRAERSEKRAESSERRAIRAVAAAKKRRENAERRLAADQRRKDVEEKARRQELARKEVERPQPEQRRSLTGRLFSLRDPALKNVNDYAARVDGSYPIAAIPVGQMKSTLLRQEVRYRTSERPGTLVVDPHRKYLYLVQSGGTAMRYGIGVGKAGFEWSGAANVAWKQAWPKWTPPEEMIERRPDLEKWSADNGGMPGGPTNPLGARALYLHQGGVDTLYRLHGTPQWQSIGTAASSGCIRLMNQDIIDLYNRVPNGTKVVVL